MAGELKTAIELLKRLSTEAALAPHAARHVPAISRLDFALDSAAASNVRTALRRGGEAAGEVAAAAKALSHRLDYRAAELRAVTARMAGEG